MITFKDGGVSSYNLLRDLNPQVGESFLSKDGTVLAIILPSVYVMWIRTDAPRDNAAVFHYSAQGDLSGHQFKRVDMEISLKAV